MGLFGKRWSDGERLEIDGLAVRLKVSRRARRVSLRLDTAGREVIVQAPSEARLADAVDFAKLRRDWIARRLEALPAPRRLAAGEIIAVFGAPWRLEPDGRRPRLAPHEAEPGGRLVGCGAGEVDPQLVVRCLRRAALEAFQDEARGHCARLGVPTPPIAVTDARTRWGSCTPARGGRGASIRLSWRLVLAPPAVADYVIAHECAHLLEANHGPRFWRRVRDLVGDERPHRAWLRAHGPSLHAFAA